MNLDKLKDFHRRRLQVLVEAGPDLLAFETIPNKLEAQVCLSNHNIGEFGPQCLLHKIDICNFHHYGSKEPTVLTKICRRVLNCLKKKMCKYHLGSVSALWMVKMHLQGRALRSALM